MPSFLIRGLARYFAASAMESRERRQSSYTPPSGTSSDDGNQLAAADLACWQTQMRWLIPFVQATGNQVVIENPKSHRQIVIDKNTKELPELSLEWMQKYDKQELLDWMAKERERQQHEDEERQKELEARRIEEARGRARFGNSFTLVDKDSNNVGMKSKTTNKGNYLIPILCICVFILALIGLWVYNSPVFEQERWEKEHQKHSVIVRKEDGDKNLKSKALEIIKNDFGGLCVVNISALHDAASLCAYGIENLYGFLVLLKSNTIPVYKRVRIISDDVLEQIENQLINVYDLVVDGTDKRKI